MLVLSTSGPPGQDTFWTRLSSRYPLDYGFGVLNLSEIPETCVAATSPALTHSKEQLQTKQKTITSSDALSGYLCFPDIITQHIYIYINKITKIPRVLNWQFCCRIPRSKSSEPTQPRLGFVTCHVAAPIWVPPALTTHRRQQLFFESTFLTTKMS